MKKKGGGEFPERRKGDRDFRVFRGRRLDGNRYKAGEKSC